MHIPSARPVLPVTEGPLAGVWAPPLHLSSHHHHLHLCILTTDADALPLRWESSSGRGVIYGASMYYDWNSFNYAHFIGII